MHGVDAVVLGNVVAVAVVGNAVGGGSGNAVVVAFGSCGSVTYFGTLLHVISSKNHKPLHYFLHNTAGYIPATCISFYL